MWILAKFITNPDCCTSSSNLLTMLHYKEIATKIFFLYIHSSTYIILIFLKKEMICHD